MSTAGKDQQDQQDHQDQQAEHVAAPSTSEPVKTDGQITTDLDEQTNAQLEKTKSQEMLDVATANAEDHLLKEFAFARFIVRCPCLLCCIILVIILILTIIFGVVFELTLQNSRTSFPDPPDKHVNDFDGYSLAAEFVEYDEEEEINSITQSEDVPFWQYFFIFELPDYKNDLDIDNPDATDYWILTPQNIEKIIQFEDKIYKDKEWHNRFCWVGEDPMETNYTCQFNSGTVEDAVISPARLIAEFYDYDYSSFTTEDAKNYTMSFLQAYSFCFNPGFIETGQSWIYRSFFRAGAPIGNGKFKWENETRAHLSDYANAEDELYETDGQMGEYYTWGFPLYSDIIINNDAALIEDGLKIQIYSQAIHGNYLFTALTNSLTFLFLAVLSVWAYMTYHLKSVFLSCGAMFGILMSFPCAFFVYRVIFQVPIFDVLSMLVVFVLLGVGADDVFVFTDAWTQSILFVDNSTFDEEERTKNCCGCDNGNEQQNIKRMSFTYRRAATAMFVTQVTTFFAFLATAMSILVNMSAFGIWAACVVMMDYVLVITLYPAVLMLHHKYIKTYEDKILCCCCRACCKKPETNKAKIRRQLSRQSSVKDIATSYGKFEKFLGTKWGVWITKYKYFVLTFFAILFIVTIIGTASLKTASKTDDAFAPDHWYVVSQKTLSKFTAAETDSLVPCHITFGIAGVDRSGVRKYRPDDYYGKIIWDKQFEMSTIEQQVYLKYICAALKNRTDLIHSPDLVYCPIEDFEQYLTDKNVNFPYEYSGTDMNQNEAFAQEWNAFLGSTEGETSMRDALSYVEYDADSDSNSYDIKFYALWYYSTLVAEAFTIDGPKFKAYLDKMNGFIDEVTGPKSDCPDNLCGSIGNPSILFVFLSIIEGYISSAVKGILIALPLAAIIMVFSTGNWIIALFALFDIIGVMLSELSIMYCLGYEFSLTESIAIVVIIGFSVDYVVHLANAYLESAAETRNERLSFSLLTIGISVVSGAATTFLAGMFLVFAEFTFFRKMGAILMTTVLMSIFWAMTFFTALCAAFGPQGGTGDLRKYFKMCWNKSKCNNAAGDETPKQMEMSIR